MSRQPPDPQAVRARWLGHATLDVRLGGARFLTDPVLRRRVAHLRRLAAPTSLETGPIDAILVSHLHHDHLDLPSLRQVARATPVVIGRGGAKVLARSDREVIEVVPGDVLELGGVRVEVVTAEHAGSRTMSRHTAPAVGFVLDSGVHRAYFPGDTDLFEEMAAIARPDLAFLPVWGWGPALGPGHLTPGRAAEAAAILDASAVVPIHWGTFAPLGVRRAAWFDLPGRWFADELAVSAPGVELHLIAPGDEVILPPGGRTGAR